MAYRAALITGASSGLGRGLALALGKRGTHVICAARRKPELDSLVAEIEGDGGSADAIVLDCADTDATYSTIRALDEKYALDLVIANAGWGAPTDAKTFDWPTAQRILQLNVLGATATLAAALPGMVERNSGHLVGIASLAGFRGLPKSSVYSSSKAMLMTLLEGMRVDLKDTGISVTTICPGYVKTELTAGRPYKLPFLMELDDAVAVMLRAIDKRESLCAFPSPLSTVTRSLPFWPEPLYQFVASRFKVRG